MSLTARSRAGYGWRPDLPDHRDRLFAAPPVETPPVVDLRAGMPAVYDQGQLGSCTGNAIAGLVEYVETLQGCRADTPSRLFIYYGERELEGSVDQDSGAQIRDGMKVVAKLGSPAEALWPYDVARFAERPSEEAYAAAREHRAIAYHRVAQTLGQLRAALASGHPVVFGFAVYEGFESGRVARSGVVELPADGEQMVGGHAVLLAGYDDVEQRFLVRNSWGGGWGENGYFTMPYEYVTDRQLASDFWTITRES